MSRLEILIALIARQEGFRLPAGVPARLNNPGGLMFAHQKNAVRARITGRDGKVRVYARFPTLADGVAALAVRIEMDAFTSRGETLSQFIGRYAPASCAAEAVKALGVADPDVPLTEALSAA